MSNTSGNDMSCDFSVKNYHNCKYVEVTASGDLKQGCFEAFEKKVRGFNKDGYSVVVIDASRIKSIEVVYLARLYQLAKDSEILIFGADPSHVKNLDTITNGVIKSVETLDDALEQAFPDAVLEKAVNY